MISLSMHIIDRAGRAYYSPAYYDHNRLTVGRHNEVEIHSMFDIELMQYVNRYNPYLPTINYFGNDLLPNWNNRVTGFASDVLTDVSGYASWNVDTTPLVNTPLNQIPHIGKRGYNYAMNHLNQYFIYTDRNPLKYVYPWEGAWGGLPRLSYHVAEDGNQAGIFGDYLYRSNSYCFIADDNYPNPRESRDNTADSQMVAYGIPFWILGGTCGDLKYPDGYSGEYDTQNRARWYSHYMKDRHPETGETYSPVHQRAGLWTWNNISPIFTKVASVVRSADVNYDNFE